MGVEFIGLLSIIIILSNAGLHHNALHLNAYLNWMWCIADAS